jgi:hypothetical protein
VVRGLSEAGDDGYHDDRSACHVEDDECMSDAGNAGAHDCSSGTRAADPSMKTRSHPGICTR